MIKGEAVRRGDRVFQGSAVAAGVSLLAIMAAIAAFLLVKAVPALTGDNSGSFLTTAKWFPDQDPPLFGIAALAFGTIISAIFAMAVAVPVGVGIALFIAHYAPRRLAQALGYVVDLLSAVPSIIFGMWGLYYFMPRTEGLARWLDAYLGWIPIFRNDLNVYTRSIFVASLVLAIMILPTISAVCREVFLQVPREHIEGALALGATRWEMVRLAVLPYGRPGMISASMLGLGRALGETIAVALVLSTAFTINWQITEPGGATFAANIALKFGEASDFGISALIASGLVLFVITLVVNMTARYVVERRREFSE
jgi:phosphate transport system permease protein